MFDRKSRAERLKEQAQSTPFVPIAALATAYAGAKPVIERLLWDDDKLRKQVEAAAEAAQAGSKRVRGQRVRSGGGGRRLLFLILVAALGFLFLNPRTGPQARKFARDTYGNLTSGE
jgi:hypothetical protein